MTKNVKSKAPATSKRDPWIFRVRNGDMLNDPQIFDVVYTCGSCMTQVIERAYWYDANRVCARCNRKLTVEKKRVG